MSTNPSDKKASGYVSFSYGLRLGSPTFRNHSSPDHLEEQPVPQKGKAKEVQDTSMDRDEDDDDEDDGDDDDDDDDDMEEEDMEEDNFEEIDPSVIKPRRTRGARVDYTSPEALAKAGLDPELEEEDADMEH
ncbi:hypothetical protein AX15_003489 [Amanita polypyramis BW_CC]|nr:hypothetical protein AX15_003489 [Amanita polypyramis BW_CC]